VQFWDARYRAGLDKMHSWLAQFGGDPAPVFDGSHETFAYWPDQNLRRWR
jgi:hypothetical protein